MSEADRLRRQRKQAGEPVGDVGATPAPPAAAAIARLQAGAGNAVVARMVRDAMLAEPDEYEYGVVYEADSKSEKWSQKDAKGGGGYGASKAGQKDAKGGGGYGASKAGQKDAKGGGGYGGGQKDAKGSGGYGGEKIGSKDFKDSKVGSGFHQKAGTSRAADPLEEWWKKRGGF